MAVNNLKPTIIIIVEGKIDDGFCALLLLGW